MRPFPRRAVVAALAIVGGFFAARMFGLKLPDSAPIRRGVSTDGQVTPADQAQLDADGNALMSRVLATLERWPNVAAKFRQTVRIADQPQAGAGEYWQQGVGNLRRSCWQWQTLIAGEPAMFTQIYDADAHLWTDIRYPGSPRTVTRVSVSSLRRDLALAAEAMGQGREGQEAAELELLARGGLSQLVAELRRNFTFGKPDLVVEDGKQFVAATGRWRADQLAREWPSLTPEATGAWPLHLPHHVVVKVGREDYFPYVIEYRRGVDADLAGDVRKANDPLGLVEFFDVRWTAVMPDRLFEFTPPEADWHDVTAKVLERLRPVAPPAPQPIARATGGWRR